MKVDSLDEEVTEKIIKFSTVDDRLYRCMYILTDLDKSDRGEYWVAEDDGEVQGVVVLTKARRLLFYFVDEDFLLQVVDEVKTFLSKDITRIHDIMGPAAQARLVIEHLGLPADAFSLQATDGLFRLDLLRNLKPYPLSQGERIEPASHANSTTLNKWVKDYAAEAMGLNLTDVAARLKVQEYQAPNSDIKILFSQSAHVALTGFSGRVLETVIVGPVYTPLEFRKNGYARRLLFAHLNHALTQEDVKSACLLAYSPDAIRLYESLGFERIDEFFWGVLN